MKPYIGVLSQLPFVLITLAWILFMQYTYQSFIVGQNQYPNYITLIIMGITIYNYLKTCFKEPGIIPNSNLTQEQARQSINDLVKFQEMNVEEQEDQILAETNRTNRRAIGSQITERAFSFNNPNSSSNTNVYSNSRQKYADFNYKYCQNCRQIKPPTSEHCSRCYACIKKHYKHSVVFANCIGQSNFKNYFWTVFCINILQLTYCYKGTMEIIKNYSDYFRITQELKNKMKNTYELQLLGIALILTIILKGMISGRFIKIKWTLNIITFGLVLWGVLGCALRPVFSVNSGFIWVFICMAYSVYPYVLKSLWYGLFLNLIGKSRRELESRRLLPEDKMPKKMMKNFYEFMFGGKDSENQNSSY